MDDIIAYILGFLSGMIIGIFVFFIILSYKEFTIVKIQEYKKYEKYYNDNIDSVTLDFTKE